MTLLRQLASGRGMLALLAGAAVTLAFSPYDFWIMAILSPAILVSLLISSKPGAAFGYGYLYGLGMFSTGTGWLHISINLFGGVSLAGAILLTLLFIMFIALFPAVAGYLSASLYRQAWPKFSLLLLIPAAWTLLEWVRSWFLTGFPWLNLGYSQTDSVLSGLGPLGGVFAIGFAVMLTAAALSALWHGSAGDRLTVIATVILVWLGGGLSARYDWTSPRPETVSVALVQGAVPQELKWSPEMLQPTLDRYTELTAPYTGTDLIIWPEAAIPAFHDQIRPYLTRLQTLIAAQGSILLTGLPYRDLTNDSYLNSVVMLDQDVSFYFKRHLVPFGEYLPLDFILRPIVDYLNIPMSDFSAGDDNAAPVLHTDGFAIGVSICYEDTFGNEVIKALPQAAILVNVSNDAWFGDSLAPHQHMQMARMRAIESGRYLLRATNTGITAIINEKGTPVSTIPQFTPMTLTGTALLFDGITPYARTGDYLVLGLIALILALAVGMRRMSSPTNTR